MANDLRIKTELDSSGIEQGAKQCEKSLGQIKRQAELAAKGLKSLSNDSGLNAVKEQFAGLGQQIDKFSRKMTSGLGIKQQARQISQQLAEVANVYRSMTSEEKASVAGQYLKQYMQELTVLGGKAKDTVQDMQAQISAMASDTPIMAGLAEGVGLVADAFTIAAGGAKALGVSEEKLADLQKKLTSLMAISNAAMNIKNALVNQGAVKTALLNIQIRANALYTSLQAAATGKATVATKAAAVAQELWNKAIKANPIMWIISGVVALGTAMYALSQKSNSAANAAKAHAEAEKKRKEEAQKTADAIAQAASQQLAVYEKLRYEWKQLSTTHEKNKWIKDNKKAFQELGLAVNSVIDAENAFNRNTDKVVKAIIARATANAYMTRIEEVIADSIRKKEAIRQTFGEEKQYRAGQWINIKKEGSGLMSGVDYDPNGSAMYDSDYRKLTAAGARRMHARSLVQSYESEQKYIRAIDQSTEKEVNHLVASMQNATRSAAQNLGKLAYQGETGTSAGRTGRTTTTTKNEQAVKGSLGWYDQEIKKLEEKLKSATDAAVYQKIKSDMVKLKNEKFFLTVELSLGKEEADKLFEQLSQPSNVPIAGNPLPVPTSITTSNPLASLSDRHTEEGIRQAQEQADRLLKSTEGLRLGAEGAANAFGALGNAIGGSAGKAIDVAGVMAGAIATMIEAYATAVAGAAKLGPWAWVAFGLTGLAQLASMIATVKQLGTYAEGGIVQGNGSFGAMNDGIVLRAHQGELLLNKRQQRNLYDAINAGFDGTSGKVEFVISGRNLRGVLNNYDSKIGRI